MKRKVTIASIVLALILAIVGFYYVSNQLMQIKNQGTLAVSHVPETEEPLAKLVYTGTNETLSEALYNLDLQDGKLERPYIVHKILGSTPDLGKNKHSLTFIDKSGRVKKKEILESSRSKIDVYITPKGNHALVYGDYTHEWGPATAMYYDIDGNLLWEKKKTLNWYTFFPDGELLIEDVLNKEGRSYNLINAKGEVTRKDFFLIDYSKIHPDFSGATMLFSPNGKYFSFRYDDANNKVTNMLIFDHGGSLLYRKDLKEYSAETGAYLSDSGYYYMLGYEPYDAFKYQIFFVFDEKGKQIYKRIQAQNERIDDFAVLDNSRIYIITEDVIKTDDYFDLLKLIDLRTSQETKVYKGNRGLIAIKMCGYSIVVNEVNKIGPGKFERKIKIIKNSKPHEIYRYKTTGLEPSYYTINTSYCNDHMLILDKGIEEKRIYELHQ